MYPYKVEHKKNSKIKMVFNVKGKNEQFLKVGNLTKVNGSFHIIHVKLKHVTKHFLKNRNILI